MTLEYSEDDENTSPTIHADSEEYDRHGIWEDPSCQVPEERRADYVPQENVPPLAFSDKALNRLVEAERRKYSFTNTEMTHTGAVEKPFDASLGVGHLFYVKPRAHHDYIHQTRWNQDCVRSTWIRHREAPHLDRIADREPIHWYQDFEHQPHAMTVVHCEGYLTPTPHGRYNDAAYITIFDSSSDRSDNDDTSNAEASSSIASTSSDSSVIYPATVDESLELDAEYEQKRAQRQRLHQRQPQESILDYFRRRQHLWQLRKEFDHHVQQSSFTFLDRRVHQDQSTFAIHLESQVSHAPQAASLSSQSQLALPPPDDDDPEEQADNDETTNENVDECRQQEINSTAESATDTSQSMTIQSRRMTSVNLTLVQIWSSI